MDTTDAKRLVSESLSIRNEECGAWSPPDRDREVFLNEHRADLVQSLVDPYPVSLIPDRSARAFGEWEDRPYTMFVVAKSTANSVLLINSETGCFSLGWVDASGSVPPWLFIKRCACRMGGLSTPARAVGLTRIPVLRGMVEKLGNTFLQLQN